jgi:S-DNA-T family DNA segregation ATPase FtsK/SpoIIIE
MAQAIWGWRLEFALGAGTFVALIISTALGSLGPILVFCALIIANQMNPELRRRLTKQMKTNREQLWLQAAFWHCAVVGRTGRTPKVVRSARLPVGHKYLVALPIGLHCGALKDTCPELAAAMGVREVRVKAIPQNARYVEVIVIRSSAFPTKLASPLITHREISLWDPIHFGVGEDGLVVSLNLVERNLLIGGEPGAGKSVALSTIVACAALDPSVHLTLLDGKHVELAPWANVADRFVGPNQTDAVNALEELRDIMDFRYATLAATKKRKIARDDPEGLHVVVIDELAFYLRGGQKATRDTFSELLRDLVSRGRAAGIIVVAATQKPSHEVVPTWIRDLFAFRLAMRCTSSDASDTILGQGWASQGFSAANIDPAQRGVGLLLAEGGLPTRIMTPFLSDDDIDILADHAQSVRTAYER